MWTMYRFVIFTLVAMLLRPTETPFTLVDDATYVTDAINASDANYVSPTNDTTYFTSAGNASNAICLVSTSNATYVTSAITLFQEFYHRSHGNINFDQLIQLRDRLLASEQVEAIHERAEALVIPYISVCRRIATDTIERFPALRSVDRYFLPRPSYENLTFHAEHGACVWTESSTGLPANFSPHVGTVFLLLATNACSIVLSVFICFTIIASFQPIGTALKAVTSLVYWPKATCQTILEKLGYALLNISQVAVTIIALCATLLVFVISNIAMLAANHLDIGFKPKKVTRLVSHVDAAPKKAKVIPDPLIEKLRLQKRRLEDELEEKIDLLYSNGMTHAAEMYQAHGENAVLEDANKAQKTVIVKLRNMLAEIGLTRPLHEQFKELQQKIKDLEEKLARTIEKGDLREKELLQRIQERDELISAQYKSLEAQSNEREELIRSHDIFEAQVKQREEIARLQKESLQSLETQIKEHEEIARSQKKSIRSLEAQIKEREELFESEKKSLETSLQKKFAMKKKKLLAVSEANLEARKAAEEESKSLKMQLAATTFRRFRSPNRCKCRDYPVFYDLAHQFSKLSLHDSKEDKVDAVPEAEEPASCPPESEIQPFLGARHVLPLPSRYNKVAKASNGPDPVDMDTFKFDSKAFSDASMFEYKPGPAK
ncbi:hypothetical protein N8I77_012374 [Diaporthe amygdali]|uniref:Uncharacterized protein n=1 Tax=Phomopsis amygdali TaxID=1214568 RepID=A0AAD9VX74_PHOAM|nr:hypothetical protein N8I77_012374 [Diaporthe amygdali]